MTVRDTQTQIKSKESEDKDKEQKALLTDLKFFTGMYEITDSLLNERYDVTKLEMLHQMIGDLVDEKVEQLEL